MEQIHHSHTYIRRQVEKRDDKVHPYHSFSRLTCQLKLFSGKAELVFVVLQNAKTYRKLFLTIATREPLEITNSTLEPLEITTLAQHFNRRTLPTPSALSPLLSHKPGGSRQARRSGIARKNHRRLPTGAQVQYRKVKAQKLAERRVTLALVAFPRL